MVSLCRSVRSMSSLIRSWKYELTLAEQAIYEYSVLVQWVADEFFNKINESECGRGEKAVACVLAKTLWGTQKLW